MLLGGLLLARARRDVAPLRSAVAVGMARVESFVAAGRDSPSGSGDVG